MAKRNIPKRLSTALINSLSAGVVPRVGLEYIAVGRKDEIEVLLDDLDNIAAGGGAFRFIIGRYGSGKSFLLQLIRNYAMERGFVVADADLSPDRKLTGSTGAGLATYRELMHNLSTKARPDGGALVAIFERWLSDIQTQVVKETGVQSDSPQFGYLVEEKIMETVNNMENLVHGFDFAKVVVSYWRGYQLGKDELKDAALRWLRGEFATKTEAFTALKVRVIINDETWYDYVKLVANFVSGIGYKGLIVLIDEAVNLYKISHSNARQNNYEKVLAMFNDTMQGKAQHLGILMGGTPNFLEDPRRGLYSYEALRSRLVSSRFTSDRFKDKSGPIIRLPELSHAEIYVLLQNLLLIFDAHYHHQSEVSAKDVEAFMQEEVNRLGSEVLLTPREVIRDFLTILNILRQHPDTTLGQILESSVFQPTRPGKDPELDADSPFAEFSL